MQNQQLIEFQAKIDAILVKINKIKAQLSEDPEYELLLTDKVIREAVAQMEIRNQQAKVTSKQTLKTN